MVKSHTHEMAHYHNTNINHGHGVTDNGHFHSHIYADAPGANETYWQNTEGMTAGGWPRVATYVGDTTYVTKLVTGYANSGVTVNGTGDLIKSSTNSLYHGTGSERNYTASNNDNNNENRPENFTIKIWKRTA